MKNAVELRFTGISNPQLAERHAVRVRFAEALQRQTVLEGGDDEAVHAFRLACKRLRFALERIASPPPQLSRAGPLLSALTDELGWAHDCAVLAGLAREHGAPLVALRAKRDRDRYVLRGRRLWRHAFRSNGEFAGLAAYAGFSWSVR